MLLDFIMLFLAFFCSLLFIMSTIADIVSSSGFMVDSEDTKLRETNAKYRIVLSFIMSIAWPYVILLI